MSTMHIYAFGSICRGEVTFGSDVDVLAITVGLNSRFDPDVYSVYSYARLKQLWHQGNPFAWHLALESRLLYASDGKDFLRDLGSPASYVGAVQDCEKFFRIFNEARLALQTGTLSPHFELSTVFLATRNFATCYSLGGATDKPDFSRSAALRLGEDSLPVSSGVYSILERCRLLSTRGLGITPEQKEVAEALSQLHHIETWMVSLLKRVAE